MRKVDKGRKKNLNIQMGKYGNLLQRWDIKNIFVFLKKRLVDFWRLG